MIVAFGEAIVDLFAEPLGCGVDEAERFVPHLGGAVANVAVVAARLGAPVRFVGAVGRDGHGERAVRALIEAGVDVSHVVRVPERTAVTFVHVTSEGARTFLFYRANTAGHTLTTAQLAASQLFEGARWLVTGTSAHITDPLASAARAITEAADVRGVPRALDLNVRAHRWPDRDVMRDAIHRVALGASLVKASEEDLLALDLPPTLDALRMLAPRAVPVLTLAERGAVAWVSGRPLAVSAPTASLRDATGAGDAFVGCILAMLQGRDWADARADVDLWFRLLDAACALGARAVSAVGATTAVRPPWPAAVSHLFHDASPRKGTP